MKRFASVLCASALLAGSAFAEGKLKLESLPAPVQKTIKDNLQNATISGISKEKEKGVTQYEVETKLNGKARDFNVDAQGKLLVMEEEVAVDSIPAAAREAIMKKVAGGKLGMVESVTQGSSVSYEAAFVSKSGKKGSVAVKADGAVSK